MHQETLKDSCPINKAHILNWHCCGTGFSYGHFGEILQGAFKTDSGLCRGLVTLPCHSVGSSVNVKISNGVGEIITPPGKLKIEMAVRAYVEHYTLSPHLTFEIHQSSSIPEGVGMGSSTSDIVATLRALDQAIGVETDSLTLAGMTLQAEKACDAIMFSDGTRLFAQREGVVVEDFACQLPAMTIVGVNTSPFEKFDTDLTPPAIYNECELSEFNVLRQELREGLKNNDLNTIAQVSTRSAEINQHHFPKPRFKTLQTYKDRFAALGICVAHSGTVSGLIFHPDQILTDTSKAEICSALAKDTIAPMGIYHL